MLWSSQGLIMCPRVGRWYLPEVIVVGSEGSVTSSTSWLWSRRASPVAHYQICKSVLFIFSQWPGHSHFMHTNFTIFASFSQPTSCPKVNMSRVAALLTLPFGVGMHGARTYRFRPAPDTENDLGTPLDQGNVRGSTWQLWPSLLSLSLSWNVFEQLLCMNLGK